MKLSDFGDKAWKSQVFFSKYIFRPTSWFYSASRFFFDLIWGEVIYSGGEPVYHKGETVYFKVTLFILGVKLSDIGDKAWKSQVFSLSLFFAQNPDFI